MLKTVSTVLMLIQAFTVCVYCENLKYSRKNEIENSTIAADRCKFKCGDKNNVVCTGEKKSDETTICSCYRETMFYSETDKSCKDRCKFKCGEKNNVVCKGDMKSDETTICSCDLDIMLYNETDKSCKDRCKFKCGEKNNVVCKGDMKSDETTICLCKLDTMLYNETDKSCKELDPCSPNPCFNGGFCSHYSGTARCTCVNGYTGKRCETALDPCSPNPCFNGGFCADYRGTARCTCINGYTGERCEIVDRCASYPCKNGGTCKNEKDYFKCTCTENYAGTDCSENIWCDKHGEDLCGKEKCGYNETQERGYCICEGGKFFNESTKKCNVDRCSSNPCKNGGFCRNEEDTYSCVCKEFYGGKDCSENNWCAKYGADLCGKEKCQYNDRLGVGHCICKNGKLFNVSSKKCTDDLCATNPCKNGGFCKIQGDTYKCICLEFYGGKDCSENTWCQKYGKDLCGKEKCQYNNEIGRGYCTCEVGKVFNISSKTCTDPCTPNPCLNGGFCLIDGVTYKCLCKELQSGNLCENDYRYILLAVLLLVLLAPLCLCRWCCVCRMTPSYFFRETEGYRTFSNVP